MWQLRTIKRPKKSVVELRWLYKRRGSADNHIALQPESQDLESDDSLSSLESMV